MMKVFDEDERLTLMAQLAAGELEMIYARGEDNGRIYCTLTQKKDDHDERRKVNSARNSCADARQLRAE